ncbi:zinc finger protein with KRAB and SCAN domains 1-like isoform X1 [Gigantopelta aegis]|uniref:zinc finger protein with KRAB and SCAN domains 1-like isoform X1 n=1 Tax=Gigantopelta aegis TaxID=1735272 RepID=UPI001B88DC64|nr:zinc finger protein with KRAB and SCAN domains 1-like isoform X1 [Gigantopelta aegis]
MDKQYSVEFFACFVDSVQKLCRDYLNFEQAVELSGYLCLEIDNSKKERYVLSELVQSSGDVISESYCTKAFKTVRKGPTTTVGYRGAENISPRYRLNQERGQREPPTSALYQHPASQFAIGIRDTRVGRNEKSQDTSTSSFMNRPSGPTSRGMTSGTDLMSSRLHHVKDSETRAIKRTASFPDDAPSSKKDTINTGSPSGVDETSISPEESIRLPLAVTVKQEHDVPFMVIDNPEGDMSEDQFHDSSEQGLGGGAENFIAARASAIGDSPEATERAPLLSRQIQEKQHAHSQPNGGGGGSRGETFTNIERMLKAQQENLMRMHTAPSYMRTMSPVSQTYSCDKCGYVSKWKSNLTRHMRLKHGEMKDEQSVGYPYSQVLYPQNMYASSTLSNFSSVAHTPAQSPSTHLETSFKSSVSPESVADEKPIPNDQTQTSKRNQEEEMSPRYRCQVPNCGQTFRKTRHLQVHMNGHYKIKPYKCEKCGEAFESHFDWKKHCAACESSTSSNAADADADADKSETNPEDTEHVSSD